MEKEMSNAELADIRYLFLPRRGLQDKMQKEQNTSFFHQLSRLCNSRRYPKIRFSVSDFQNRCIKYKRVK